MCVAMTCVVVGQKEWETAERTRVMVASFIKNRGKRTERKNPSNKSMHRLTARREESPRQTGVAGVTDMVE